MRFSGVALVALLLGGMGLAATPQSEGAAQGPVLTKAEWDRIFKQVSNWGRWGKDDQRGTYNLLTAEKRKQAAALVKSGISVSLEHPIIEEKAVDVPTPLQKTNHGNRLLWESVHGGRFHSHIDALCHMSQDGKLYNGYLKDEVDLEQGCVKMDLMAWKDGIVTRGILIDMPRFKGVPWLDPGTAVTRQDIESWEKKTGVKVLPGDAVFLRTGRWAKRAATGPWDARDSISGYHWSVLPWFKARDVTLVSSDGPNDSHPDAMDKALGNLLPIHIAVIVGMGAMLVDGVDLDAAAEVAARLNRWDFMLTGAPLAISGGSGVSINLTATF